MRISKIVPIKLVLLSILGLVNCNGLTSPGSRTSAHLVAASILLYASGIPEALSLPAGTGRAALTHKNHGYYRWANNLLSWVFSQLDDDDEDDDKSGSGRTDLDSLEVSSEEDGFPILSKRRKVQAKKVQAKKVQAKRVQKQKLAQSRHKGRVGNVVPANPKPATVGPGYDPAIEDASIPELKKILTRLKKQDSSIFSAQTITSPMSSSLWTMGTGMFRKVYCGLSSKNSYCANNDHAVGADSFFNGFKKAVGVLRSLQ